MSFLRKFFGVPEDSTVWPPAFVSIAEPVSDWIDDAVDAIKERMETVTNRDKALSTFPLFYPLDFVEDVDPQDRFTVPWTYEGDPPDRLPVYSEDRWIFAYGNLVGLNQSTGLATYELYYHSIWSPLDDDAEFCAKMRIAALQEYRNVHGYTEDWMFLL